MAIVLGIPGALASLQRELSKADVQLGSAEDLEALIDHLAASLTYRQGEEFERVRLEAEGLRERVSRLELDLQRQTLQLVAERLQHAASVADRRYQARSSRSFPARFAHLAIATLETWTRRAQTLHLELPIVTARFHMGSLARQIDAKTRAPEEVVHVRTRRERQRLERAQAAKGDPTYIGALAEEEVARELVKLPDSHWVLHDVLVKLPTPITFRGEKRQKVQLDHVVVAPSGIFVLETKRWSAASARTLSCPWHQAARNAFFMRCALRERGIDPPVKALLVNLGTLPARPDDVHANVVRVGQLNQAVCRGSQATGLEPQERQRIAELLWRASSWA